MKSIYRIIFILLLFTLFAQGIYAKSLEKVRINSSPKQLVLDISGANKSNYQESYDKKNKKLTITLLGTTNKISDTKVEVQNDFIKNYLISSAGNNTIIEISLIKELSYKITTWDNPTRLVIDFSNSSLESDDQSNRNGEVFKPRINNKPVQFVLDLKIDQPLKYKSTFDHKKNRLQILLEGVYYKEKKRVSTIDGNYIKSYQMSTVTGGTLVELNLQQDVNYSLGHWENTDRVVVDLTKTKSNNTAEVASDSPKEETNLERETLDGGKVLGARINNTPTQFVMDLQVAKDLETDTIFDEENNILIVNFKKLTYEPNLRTSTINGNYIKKYEITQSAVGVTLKLYLNEGIAYKTKIWENPDRFVISLNKGDTSANNTGVSDHKTSKTINKIIKTRVNNKPPQLVFDFEKDIPLDYHNYYDEVNNKVVIRVPGVEVANNYKKKTYNGNYIKYYEHVGEELHLYLQEGTQAAISTRSKPRRLVVAFSKKPIYKNTLEKIRINSRPIQIVFDFEKNRKLDYTKTFNSKDKTLEIRVKNTKVGENAKSKTLNGNYVINYKIRQSGSDAIITLKLRDTTKYNLETRKNPQRLVLNLSKTKKNYRIIIDAGHGGSNLGANYNGIVEKKINLEVANYLKAELQGEYHVTMVRNYDHFISLGERARRGNVSGGNIFVSIHANAAPSKNARGFEIFYYGGGKSSHRRKSINVANSIMRRYPTLMGIPKRKVASANFKVLREFKGPGILVELGFLSNYKDAKILKSTTNKKRAAQIIAQGIRENFK